MLSINTFNAFMFTVMTPRNNQEEPSVQQALAQLTQTIEHGVIQQNGKFAVLADKIEILTDQIGRMTEGLTMLGLDIAEIKETTKQQAEAAKQQAEAISTLGSDIAGVRETTRQQVEIARLQAESVSRLVTLLEKK